MSEALAAIVSVKKSSKRDGMEVILTILCAIDLFVRDSINLKFGGRVWGV